MFAVKDKVAIITGAATGIGYAVAQKLVTKGCHVVVGDIDDDKGQSAVAALKKQRQVKALYVHCDVGDFDQIRTLINTTVEQLGGVDILINHAGIPQRQWFLDDTDLNWTSVLCLNIHSTIFATQYILKLWDTTKSLGVIVNTASAAGLGPFPASPVYAASKAAIIHFTASLKDFERQGIRVNAVAPFFVEHLKDLDWTNVYPQLRTELESATFVSMDQVVQAFIKCIEDESLAGQTLSVFPSTGVQVHAPDYPER
ncbi:hypothetical protein H4R34_000443 [Dimargaris verticillata]|uniref:Uncharacterized protein n=1 Tax=Dimargaris verticillata TaxID=2761393 RepID=A0A9W8BBQ7_9FUNG|nr:hypothetical protein H4R34_000443 [Dimargaris verticillata]